MKKYSALVLLAVALTTAATHVYGQVVVGYVNVPLQGTTLFSNPLLNDANDLAALFGNQTPEGTTISLWNSTSRTFDVTSQFLGGAWTVDLTLMPGMGARLITPSPFTNTFVGSVLNHNGSLFHLGDTFAPPPPFVAPDGVYLLGDKAPIASSGSDIFLNVLGRAPNFGEQFTGSDGVVCTYLGGGVWDHTPSLSVGGAGFFSIIAVPEPSVAAVGLVGLVVLGIVRRRQRVDACA